MNDNRRRLIDVWTLERDQLVGRIREELTRFRPIGQASELSLAMGTRPSRGVLIGTPLGTFAFAKARMPDDATVDRWQEWWRLAEVRGRDIAAAGSFGIIEAGCTIGNAEFTLTGCHLRDFDWQAFGLDGPVLDDDEVEFLRKLIAYWNGHTAESIGVVTVRGDVVEFNLTPA